MDGDMLIGIGAAGEKRALRILLSAYACEPDRGSEPGIGWQWAVTLARRGHEVWVLTRANNREAIERAGAVAPDGNLHFVYYDLPAYARWWKRGGRGVRFYYFLWQWGAYRAARKLCSTVRFDLVHHITFGVFRQPSFLAFLDLPFIFGPVGGGESAPHALRKTYSIRGRVIDRLRDLANAAVRLDPLMAAVFRRSALIVCKTGETLDCIPEKYRHKCLVQPEVGIDPASPFAAPPRNRDDGCFRILFVGRLVYWKGLHLGLMAFARLKEMHPCSRLTVIGSGPDERWLRGLARRLGIEREVTWTPWLTRAAVMRSYGLHDVFLFPSLHDSSGNAVLEALAAGLPVVCLNTGGPAVLVDSSCGYKVPAGEPQSVVDDLARALALLAADPPQRRALSVSAVRRAVEQFSWTRQVGRMEQRYLALCSQPQAGSARRTALMQEAR